MNNDPEINDVNQGKIPVRRLALVATRRNGSHISGSAKVSIKELNPVVPLRKYDQISLKCPFPTHSRAYETLTKKLSRPKNESKGPVKIVQEDDEQIFDKINSKNPGSGRREIGVQTSDSMTNFKKGQSFYQDTTTPTSLIGLKRSDIIFQGQPHENPISSMTTYDVAANVTGSSEYDYGSALAPSEALEEHQCSCSCDSRELDFDHDATGTTNCTFADNPSPAMDPKNLHLECGCGTNNIYSFWASQIPPIPSIIACPLIHHLPYAVPHDHVSGEHCCQRCSPDRATPDITITSDGDCIVHTLFPLPTDGSYRRYYISGFDVAIHEYCMTSRNTNKRIRLDFYSLSFADPEFFETEVEDNGNIVISGNIFGSLSRLWVFVESLKVPDNVSVENPSMYYYTIEIPVTA